MKLLSLIHVYLFAVGKQNNDVAHPINDDASTSTLKRFYVDGNNLMGHKGTPKHRQDVAEKLKSVKGAEIVVVYDGSKKEGGEKDIKVEAFDTSLFSQVELGAGMSADDFIQQEIQDMLKTMPRAKIEVVTADRLLRRQVLDMKPVVRGVINPVVFWKRYRPRLTGLKSNYVNNNLPHTEDNNYLPRTEDDNLPNIEDEL